MRRLLDVIFPLSQVLPLGGLINLSRRRAILPFYHTISDVELIHIKHLYKVKKVIEFEKDLDFLLKYYKPIGVEELRQFNYELRNLKGNNFLLTFDDGLKEFKEIIAPILQKKGVPAICFLNPAFIGNEAMFYRHKVSLLIERLNNLKEQGGIPVLVYDWFSEQQIPFGKDFLSLKKIRYSDQYKLDEIAALLGVDFEKYLNINQPYLDWDEIRSLEKQGFHFGAHSIDHPPFAELSGAEQLRQFEESLDTVKRWLNLDYNLFAFPFSDRGIPVTFLQRVLYQNSPIADLTFGTAGLKLSVFDRHLQRIAMEQGKRFAAAILKDEYLRCIIRAILGMNRTRHK
ncbi:polysaccharide deacetylase family protein [Desertivirga arenae]|uniref:polysaccharide deacetylase family protein n=1 Tax=Desertivirga arenae TaxID=2810309 RepID=UPI001A973616|nr:polysaccharide deacetylase family protein [Pedobacter sp. SYSU D00823]